MATRLEVETDILYALDEPSTSWAAPALDQGLHNMVQSAYQEAWDIILAKYEDYNLDSVDFVITSGNEYILIASSPSASQIATTTFYKLRSLMRLATDGKYLALESFRIEESGGLQLGNGIGYMFFTNSILIEPAALAAGSYRAWYVFNQPVLTDDSSQLVDPTHGAVRQYVIDVVCCRLKAKDEQPPGAFKVFADALAERLDRMASHRDSRPRKIPDVRGRGSLRYRTGRFV